MIASIQVIISSPSEPCDMSDVTCSNLLDIAINHFLDNSLVTGCIGYGVMVLKLFDFIYKNMRESKGETYVFGRGMKIIRLLDFFSYKLN